MGLVSIRGERVEYDFVSEIDKDLFQAHSSSSEAWSVKMADVAL